MDNYKPRDLRRNHHSRVLRVGSALEERLPEKQGCYPHPCPYHQVFLLLNYNDLIHNSVSTLSAILSWGASGTSGDVIQRLAWPGQTFPFCLLWILQIPLQR